MPNKPPQAIIKLWSIHLNEVAVSSATVEHLFLFRYPDVSIVTNYLQSESLKEFYGVEEKYTELMYVSDGLPLCNGCLLN